MFPISALGRIWPKPRATRSGRLAARQSSHATPGCRVARAVSDQKPRCDEPPQHAPIMSELRAARPGKADMCDIGKLHRLRPVRGNIMSYKSDIEIAREANKKPIQEIGEKLGIHSDHLLPYGHDKAKISQDFINSVQSNENGKLILVTAINPTPAGEGKTTTTVGLGDGLNRIGKKAAICIREASLGPCFGMKGGAAGGGYAQVVPMEEMNLHFTGDFHAITTAHSLLSAMIDNHIYWGNELGIDERRVVWRRVLDMNDRALRDVVTSLGGVANGFPRQTGFDITVASEVMAILCLSTDLDDLERRLGNIIVAYTRDKKPITCRDIKDDGAMTVLLGRDAAQPCADAGKQPGLRAWWSFREYRAWLQLGHGDDNGSETGRLRRHRSGFRGRSGCREVHEHQVPQGRAGAVCGGGRGDSARDEDERRRRQGRSGRGKCRGGQEGLPEPWPPYRERQILRRACGRGDQPFRDRHRRRSAGREGLRGRAGLGGDPVPALGERV